MPILSIEGEAGTGKSSFSLTAPLKEVGFSWDLGMERAIYGAKYQAWFEGLKVKFVPYGHKPKPEWKDYDITIYNLPQPINLDSVRIRGANALWEYFLALYNAALADPQVRSIAVDTMTLARRIRADAYLEVLQNGAFDAAGKRLPGVALRERLLQIEYGNPNDAIRDLYNGAKSVGKNLIAIHHLTDERADMPGKDGQVVQGVLTGNRVLEGFAQTYRFVDIALRTQVGVQGKEKKVVIAFRLLKCGYDIAANGSSLDNPNWDMLMDYVDGRLGGRLNLERREYVPA